MPGPLPGSEPRANPAVRNERAVEKLAEELSIEPNLLRELFPTETSAPSFDPNAIQEIVRNAVRQEIAPIQAQNEADAYMRQNFPEAYQHRQELEMYVRTAPPEVQQDIATLMGAGNVAGAYRVAWNGYQSSLQSAAHNHLTTQAQAAETERLASRGAASMPTAPQGTPPHAVSQDPSAPNVEQEKQLLKAAQDGDYNAQKAYTALKFGSLPGLKEKLDALTGGQPGLLSS